MRLHNAAGSIPRESWASRPVSKERTDGLCRHQGGEMGESGCEQLGQVAPMVQDEHANVQLSSGYGTSSIASGRTSHREYSSGVAVSLKGNGIRSMSRLKILTCHPARNAKTTIPRMPMTSKLSLYRFTLLCLATLRNERCRLILFHSASRLEVIA